MCRMNKKDKQNLLNILAKPDIQIEHCNYTEYLSAPIKYYKVLDLHLVSLMELSVTPGMLAMERCEIILQNKKYSHLVRPNAVFHTPMAADIVEVYNWLKLRYLLQQSRNKTGQPK